MADPGYGSVVGRRVHLDDSGAAGLGEGRDERDVRRLGDPPGHDHPRAIDEQIGSPGGVAGYFEAGHWMTTDIPNTGGVGALQQCQLGACHVGDHGHWRKRRPPSTGQVIERGEAGRRWAGEHHQVGIGERAVGGPSRPFDHAVGHGTLRSFA